jgi:acyl-CoA synthetase (NDP forming)
MGYMIENLSLMSNTSNKYPAGSLIMKSPQNERIRLVDSRSHKLARLFSPRSIAFVGGTIAAMAIRRSVEMGYRGEIWPVHPTRKSMEGYKCYRSIKDLPGVPDAAHISVNREVTIDIVSSLSQAGAGGCVCYAAGFAEMGAGGRELEQKLIEAAGNMPLIGPNTFGFLNFLDRCALWPYLFGCEPVDRGVALISQSGNIAMNLTMNLRSVNFTHVIGTGNQSVLGPGDYIDALLDDARVRAIGMYIEGIDDIGHFCRAAARALEQGVPIVVLKVGKTRASEQQSSTHTSSLTGSDTLHDALFKRLGVIRVHSLNRMLETLKVLDLAGPLEGNNVLSLSCSGGEASIMADLAVEFGLEMKPFSSAQMVELNAQFENYVTVSNPFDYNTSIWGDGAQQQRCFTAAMSGDHDAAFLIYDHPSVCTEAVANEVNEWVVTLDAFIAAHKSTGMPAFVLCTISELLPKSMRDHLLSNGVVPLQGFEDGLFAYSVARAYYAFREDKAGTDILPRIYAGSAADDKQAVFLDEWESKSRLGDYGVSTPVGELTTAGDAVTTAERVGYPVAVKAVGEAFLHKSDLGAVKLSLNSAEEVEAAVREISDSVGKRSAVGSQLVAEKLLIERMVTGAVAELIIGIKRDEQFGPVLVIGAGGILVELLADSVSLLLPVNRAAVAEAINSLTVSKLLTGFRGKLAGDINAVIDATLDIAAFAEDHWDTLLELDINPLMVLRDGEGVVAADALICMNNPEYIAPESLGDALKIKREQGAHARI